MYLLVCLVTIKVTCDTTITVPEPLSAGVITMSCRCLSWRIACRSEVVRLSRIGLGLHVVMSVSRACSLLVGGFQVL